MKPLVLVNESYHDSRGEVYPFWKFNDDIVFVEDRFSRSKYGVIRGFHGDAITSKLCGCIYGSLLLILWDMEENKKYEYKLTDENKVRVLIPPNYLNAHQCLSEECILFYKWDQPYNSPEQQWSINYKDPTIDAKWPIDNPEISERDRNSKCISKT